jgi:hypothetical protein
MTRKKLATKLLAQKVQKFTLIHLFLRIALRSLAWELMFVMVLFPSADADRRLDREMYRLHKTDTNNNTSYWKKKQN